MLHQTKIVKHVNYRNQLRSIIYEPIKMCQENVYLKKGDKMTTLKSIIYEPIEIKKTGLIEKNIALHKYLELLLIPCER